MNNESNIKKMIMNRNARNKEGFDETLDTVGNVFTTGSGNGDNEGEKQKWERIGKGFSEDLPGGFVKGWKGSENTGLTIGKGSENTGLTIGKGSENTGVAIGKGSENTGVAIGSGLQTGGEAVGSGLQSAGEAVGGFFKGGAGFNAYRAGQQQVYISPHMKRKNAANAKSQQGVAKVMAGTGPIAMMIIYILDFFIDLVINIISSLSEILMDGFYSLYNLVLGEYQGVLPENNTNGTYVNFQFFRTFITILTPPLGVFMAKGLKGWMNIIICLILCYIHFLLGILYAFVITFKNKYADHYENKQIENAKQIEAAQAAAGQNTASDYAIIFGGICIVSGVLGLFYYILSKI
jgi:uncharacterized membrane protein YqaE (UPF0057 family)